MSATSLRGSRALVTGASSGIGRSIALAIGREGSHVALCARRRKRLEEAAAEIEWAGGQSEVVEADLSSEEETVAAVARSAEALGGLDILINAAGIGRQAPLIDGATGDWNDMFQLNVLALATASREALRFFPQSGGRILNISSMSGHRVPGRGGFYSATKFAVRALTEGLRQELRHAGNLTRVGSISPGFVDTELLEDYFRSGQATLTRAEAIQFPILEPDDIAAVALQMLSTPENVDITDVMLRPTAQST